MSLHDDLKTINAMLPTNSWIWERDLVLDNPDYFSNKGTMLDQYAAIAALVTNAATRLMVMLEASKQRLEQPQVPVSALVLDDGLWVKPSTLAFMIKKHTGLHLTPSVDGAVFLLVSMGQKTFQDWPNHPASPTPYTMSTPEDMVHQFSTLRNRHPLYEAILADYRLPLSKVTEMVDAVQTLADTLLDSALHQTYQGKHPTVTSERLRAEPLYASLAGSLVTIERADDLYLVNHPVQSQRTLIALLDTALRYRHGLRLVQGDHNSDIHPISRNWQGCPPGADPKAVTVHKHLTILHKTRQTAMQAVTDADIFACLTAAQQAFFSTMEDRLLTMTRLRQYPQVVMEDTVQAFTTTISVPLSSSLTPDALGTPSPWTPTLDIAFATFFERRHAVRPRVHQMDPAENASAPASYRLSAYLETAQPASPPASQKAPNGPDDGEPSPYMTCW